MTDDPRRDALERVLTFSNSRADSIGLRAGAELMEAIIDARAYVATLEAEVAEWKHNAAVFNARLVTMEAEVERLRKERCQHGWRGFPPEDGRSIFDRCPACNNRTLFIGTGGHLTCSWLKCSEPGVSRVIDSLRARLASAEKVVEAAAAFVTSRMGSGTWDVEQRALLAAVREHEEGKT